MPAPPKRYRQWPKKYDGLRNVIDRDKVRDQFLSSQYYAWADFCAAYNYDPSARKKAEFPTRAWQQEWLQQQVQTTEDSLMNQALDTKKLIAMSRLEFPKKWNDTAKVMSELSNFLLIRESKAAHHDTQYAKEIERGEVKARSTITPVFLGALALAQVRIQDLQRQALLMPSSNAYEAVVPIRDMDPILVEAESEEQRLKAIEVQLVGGGTLDEGRMTQILSKWVDQQAVGADAEFTELEPEEERSPESDFLPPTEVEE